MGMFELQPRVERARWNGALGASFALQSALLLVLLYPSPAKTVLPSEVALGTRGSYGTVTYLAPTGPELAKSIEPPQVFQRKTTLRIKPQPPEPVDRQREAANATAVDAPAETARGGSPWGSHIPGTPLTGSEVMPALPEVFPDPQVTAADLPHGIQGDVIVEVTIDENGNVTEEKLLKGIGYGIEEKVLAVLRNWHFRPATQNGVTIASQHIVHFHYPS
jgi:TonB family protein